eukprot:1538903-Pleurochrysis_carterae.AAC.1
MQASASSTNEKVIRLRRGSKREVLIALLKMQRFVSGAFGIMSVFFPHFVAYLLDSREAPRRLPFEERVTLRSWGAFILAFAYLAHQAARTFDASALYHVAVGFGIAFTTAAIVCAQEAFGKDRDQCSDEFRFSVILSG